MSWCIELIITMYKIQSQIKFMLGCSCHSSSYNVPIKAGLDPSLRPQIFFNFFLYVTNTLNINSVAYFDSAMILKIDPFPYMDTLPYMEILVKSGPYAFNG